MESEEALRSAEPPWDAIEALAKSTESMGVTVFARSTDAVYYLAVRCWVGAFGHHFEDVASGAANACLAAWLSNQKALPVGNGGATAGFYRVSQGREIQHDAIIELSVDENGDVWSGGRVCTAVEGALQWW